MSAVRRGYFAMPGVSAGFDFLFDQLDELYTSTGVRMGAAYTLLFQGLSGGPWDQYGGAGFRGLMGEPNDMAGIAFSYAFPSDSSLRQEKVLEGFNRWQLTRFSQASVGAQAIFDPGNGPDHDVVGAFWGRLRIVF